MPFEPRQTVCVLFETFPIPCTWSKVPDSTLSSDSTLIRRASPTAGYDNGCVRLWNFSSGACLCTMLPTSSEEVTCVVAVRAGLLRHVLVGGWDRKV